MIGQAITSILTNDSGVTALVGTKIFPLLMEEDTKLPAIVYSVDSLEATYDKSGWANDDVRFDVRMMDKSYSSVNALATAVRTALEITSGTYLTTIIMERIYIDGYAEFYDQEGDSDVIILNFRTKIKQY